MGNRPTPDERRRELYEAYHALYRWFTEQPLPPDRWHEIDAASVDREIAVRFVKALENARDAEPEWTNELLHTEPFATLWSQTKHGRPDMRRYTMSGRGAFNVGHPASPLPERDWKGQFAKMLIPESANKAAHPAAGDAATMTTKDPKCVFVVHGRNKPARDAMFAFLRAIGLDPLEWSEAIHLTGKTSPYIGEVLDAAFGAASAVVVLMTPDDEARLCDQFIIDTDDEFERNLTPQARPNVLFEAGMAMGRDPDRTILIEVGKLRPFSDVAGRHMIRMDNSTERRQNLAARLATAGCPVNLNATDWHSAGDFSEV